jgi:hypothetical protein
LFPKVEIQQVDPNVSAKNAILLSGVLPLARLVGLPDKFSALRQIGPCLSSQIDWKSGQWQGWHEFREKSSKIVPSGAPFFTRRPGRSAAAFSRDGGRSHSPACSYVLVLAQPMSGNSIELADMNRAWHSRNKMPSKATLRQRIDWHRKHQKYCACRKVPENLARYFARKQA